MNAADIKTWFEASGKHPGSGQDEDKSGPPVPLTQIGIAATKDLTSYAAAIATKQSREQVSALLPDSAYFNVHRVRSPESLLFATSAAQAVAFFAGLQPIAEDPDSGSILAAAWDGSGVASFLFNDGPGDFFVVAKSIEALLRGGGKRPKDTAKLEERYRQHIWIAQIVFDHENWYIDDDDVLASIEYAKPLAQYTKERALLGTRPDLASSWLLAHALAGRDAELVDAIAASAKSKHPAVKELRDKLKKPRAIDALVRKKAGLDAALLAEIRAAFV